MGRRMLNLCLLPVLEDWVFEPKQILLLLSSLKCQSLQSRDGDFEQEALLNSDANFLLFSVSQRLLVPKEVPIL